MIESPYQPSPDRYDDGMVYRRAGRSGVLLPAFSLGMWHNFGSGQAISNVQRMAHYAFDRGITQFDLANNYGPADGTAEENFAGNPGQVMFVIRDGGEDDNSRFIPIAAQNEGDWQALHEQAVGDIVVAHSWFRTLSGLDYAAGFSAERILHEYEVALNTVILAEQDELTEPIRAVIASVLGLDTTSLQIVNRPPTRSKPIYMKVWEARKADGLDYDPEDERQQAFLSEITKYNIRSIE